MLHDSENILCAQVIPRQSGFDLPVSNDFQTLLTYSEAYFHLGYSVIPLLGDRDPSRPKVPAVPWMDYQKYRASLQEQEGWFQEGSYAGLGIVTGRISQLIVLDFDSQALFNTFKVQFPDLTETHTVQSAGRGLPHLYFKLPGHLHLDSHKGQGIDLLSNGRYVVAPPTTFNGAVYRITRGGMPKPLTERDIRRIQSFMKSCSSPPPITPQLATPPAIPPPALKATPKDLHALYHYWCQRGGRNEALFRTSLFARDTGWPLTETLCCLLDLHSHQPATAPHSKETSAQRQQEAQRTVRSAFSRPPQRNRKAKQVADTQQLPNSVREVLMQQKKTYLIRTLEGLALANFRPGQVFSMQQAEEALSGLVGRDSVHNALHAVASSGSAFFVRVSPTAPLHTANAVAESTRRLNNKNCFLLLKKHQEKPQGGRPQHYYRMPSIPDLCRLLGVKPTHSDPVERTDLTSAHQTRMALHRELMKRRPGQYTRRWLAHRLGVTLPTINRYNRLIPIHSRPTYIETPIRWGNIERLPFDEPLRGAFLITLKGKKYPALRTIASMLLAKGEGVCLKERGANIYWYGDAQPPDNLLSTIQARMTEKQQTMEAFLAQKRKVSPSDRFSTAPQPPFQPVLKPGRVVKTKHKNVHKPFADTQQEALANLIYTTINADHRKTISRANARRITLMQPESRVRTALHLVQQRKTVLNPTGFLMTLLRSKYK